MTRRKICLCRRWQEGVSATKEDNESSDPDPATTTSDSQNKRKQGQRGRNQYSEGQWTVNAISVVGEPIDPLQIVAKFRNAISAIIKAKMVSDTTIPNWPWFPRGKKRQCGNCWAELLFSPEELEIKWNIMLGRCSVKLFVDGRANWMFGMSRMVSHPMRITGTSHQHNGKNLFDRRALKKL